MFRSITIASILCLSIGGESFAQGLLGKGHVSSQFLLFETKPVNGFRFENYSQGWQAQINAPLIWLENDDPFSGVALDMFATLNGVKLASQNDLGDTNRAASIGGDLGFNLFFHAHEDLRPFATAGVIWDTTRLDSVTVTPPPTTARTDLVESAGFVGLGAEVDVVDWLAWRSSYVFKADAREEHDIINEVYIRPSQSWFARLSLVIDTGGNKTGGIGAGLTW